MKTQPVPTRRLKIEVRLNLLAGQTVPDSIDMVSKVISYFFCGGNRGPEILACKSVPGQDKLHFTIEIGLLPNETARHGVICIAKAFGYFSGSEEIKPEVWSWNVNGEGEELSAEEVEGMALLGFTEPSGEDLLPPVDGLALLGIEAPVTADDLGFGEDVSGIDLLS